MSTQRQGAAGRAWVWPFEAVEFGCLRSTDLVEFPGARLTNVGSLADCSTMSEQHKWGGVGLGHRTSEPLRLSMPSGARTDKRFGEVVGAVGPGENHPRLRLDSLHELPFPPDFELRTAVFLMGNPAYLTFRRRVLEAQIARAKKLGRVFIATLPEGVLDTVEYGQKMVKAAAKQCRALLAAARAKLGDAAGKNGSIRALSGYRPVEKERDLWNGYFEQYYWATYEHLMKFPGGSTSEAAVQYVAAYVSDRKAAPGYGNHSAGVAMDFSTTVGRVTYSTRMSQKAGWKKTPFYHWLRDNAGEFDFHPYVKEPWHWEFKK